MPALVFVAHDGGATALDVPEGTTVMHAALAHGVPGITADCNGYALCATCHVFADHALLPPMDDAEDALLDGTAAPTVALPASFGSPPNSTGWWCGCRSAKRNHPPRRPRIRCVDC